MQTLEPLELLANCSPKNCITRSLCPPLPAASQRSAFTIRASANGNKMQTSAWFNVEKKTISYGTERSVILRPVVQDSDDWVVHIKGITQDFDKVELFQEENMVFEKITEKVPQLNEKFVSLNTKRVMKTIQELTNEKPNAKRFSDKEIMEAAKQRDRKNRIYAVKLKFCSRTYANLNEKLMEEIKLLKRLHTSSEDHIAKFKVCKEEIYQLEAKIKRYNSELFKLEKKHPWLKTTDLKLPVIMAELLKLENLRQEHKQLRSTLDRFQGLSTDLTDARRQLALIRAQFKRLSVANK